MMAALRLTESPRRRTAQIAHRPLLLRGANASIHDEPGGSSAMTATTQFDQVSIIKRANVYFDGKCISHTVLFEDGTRKTLGVIMPGVLNFGTDAPELMEVQAGQCRIRLEGSDEWKTYGAGESFMVPGKSRFDIDVIEMLDYICSYL
jgi:uncharacterized protein YaiE (UPF0345 family)